MFKGVYVGKYAELQNKRTLILGESHYDKNGDNNFSTYSVVENFKNNPHEKKYIFFRKIAESCGFQCINISEFFDRFWDKVYFGNYVEDLCGIGDNKAKELIKNNRQKYNDNLFNFINENQIDNVLVFGRLVFNNLPSLSNDKDKRAIESQKDLNSKKIFVGKQNDWISHCRFLAHTSHNYTNIELTKDVDVYSMRHPSCQRGFCSDNYCEYLKGLFE